MTGLSLDLDTVVQELLVTSGIEDLVTSGDGVVHDELVGGLGRGGGSFRLLSRGRMDSERDGGRTGRKQILMGRTGRLEARVAVALPDSGRLDGPAEARFKIIVFTKHSLSSMAQCPSGLRGVIRIDSYYHLCFACIGSNPVCVEISFCHFFFPLHSALLWLSA